MTDALPTSFLELRSRVTQGQLELSLVPVELRAPGDDEVVIRIEASPINPSDLGLLLGPADMSTAVAMGTPDSPVTTATIPALNLRMARETTLQRARVNGGQF